jgi:hypothetical protein
LRKGTPGTLADDLRKVARQAHGGRLLGNRRQIHLMQRLACLLALFLTHQVAVAVKHFLHPMQ